MLKAKFLNDFNNVKNPEVVVTVVQLPTGAKEVITNTQETISKCEYLLNAYDDNFCLKNNSSVKIVGYVIV